MRKSLTWAAVGSTLVAGVLAIAATANAGTAAPRPTSLTIAVSKPMVVAGGTEVISGTLRAGHTALAGEPVRLETVDARGGLHPTGLTGVTAKNTGLAIIRFVPHVTATYELVFPGARGLAPSHSGRGTVKVVKIATKLTIATSATSIIAGSKAAISGTLTAGTKALGGRAVSLYRVNALGQLLGRVGVPHLTAPGTGAVSFTVAPLTTTSYKLVWPGGWQYAASRSMAVKITVKKTATTLTLTASATSVTKGAHVTLTGNLAMGTTPLGNKLVELYSVGADGKLTLLADGARITSATGTATFTRTPGTTITFELVFHGTPLLAASKSGPVTVKVMPA